MIIQRGTSVVDGRGNKFINFALTFPNKVFPVKTVVFFNRVDRNSPVGKKPHRPGVQGLDASATSLDVPGPSGFDRVIGNLLESGPARQSGKILHPIVLQDRTIPGTHIDQPRSISSSLEAAIFLKKTVGVPFNNITKVARDEKETKRVREQRKSENINEGDPLSSGERALVVRI